MSEVRESEGSAPLDAADWLGLMAAPAFAIMALLTGAYGGGPADRLCSAVGITMSGMTLMYGLMSIFHAAPWLKLISRRMKRRHGAVAPRGA